MTLFFKMDNALVFSTLVSFIDGVTQMMRIPTMHAYLESVVAPERWRVTFIRTIGFFTMLLITSPLLVLFESTSAIRGLAVGLCLIKVASNIAYSLRFTYWIISFGEIVNSGIRILVLFVVSFHTSHRKSNTSTSWMPFLSVFAPFGIFVGASCSVIFKDLDLDIHGMKIDAMNCSGIFSALLWIYVSVHALFTNFANKNVSETKMSPNVVEKHVCTNDAGRLPGGYTLLSTCDESQDSGTRIEENINPVGTCIAVFTSLKLLFSQRSFLTLYFIHFVLTFAHVLLVIMLIILPRDFFQWDLYYSGLAAITYGTVDTISVCLLACLARFHKSSNPFVILYGTVATFLGLVCCIVMQAGGFKGSLSSVCFFFVIILVESGFTCADEGIRRVVAVSNARGPHSFGFPHSANIFLVPRIISSAISGVMLDFLPGYCAFLATLMLLGMAGFLIYWDEWEPKS